MTKDIIMNTGTRTGTLWLTSTELFVVVSECKWMELFILLLVLADFWYGKREASKRYQIAKENNDIVNQNEYRWRPRRRSSLRSYGPAEPGRSPRRCRAGRPC